MTSAKLVEWIGNERPRLPFRFRLRRSFAGVEGQRSRSLAYLDRGGLQVMLEELGSPMRTWMKCDLERPFGRGVNFQFRIGDVDRVAAKFVAADWPLLLQLEDQLYRVGDREVRVRQFAAPDPNGYVVRFSQDIEG